MSNGRPWQSHEDVALRALLRLGKTDVQIGRALDRHPVVIYRRRHELGLKPGVPAPLRILPARARLAQIA